jgi:hypothetical protein
MTYQYEMDERAFGHETPGALFLCVDRKADEGA